MANKNTKINKLSTYLYPLYLAAGVIVAIIAIVAVKTNWDIAEWSGAFHRGELEVYVGNYTMIP